MARVTILVNRGGGTVRSDPNISNKIDQAFAAVGFEVDLQLIAGSDCAMRCRAIVQRGDELLIVGGGDGTISAAASVLAGTETLLGILPLGTLNHFARDLGLPNDLKEAVDLIVRRPERRVDVGEMNGSGFINNSTIGLYPRMVLDRDLQRRQVGRGKGLAMIIATIRTLVRFGHQRLILAVNDEQARVDTPLLFVGNNQYRLDISAPGQRDCLDRGELSVFVMRKKTRLGFIRASIRALFNRDQKDDMVQLEHVERLKVESRQSRLAVSLDGEVMHANPPLDYKIRKRALRVIAP